MSASGHWLRRLKEFLQPPRTLRVTSAGKAFIVLTLAVGIAALNTGNNLLYLVLGGALSTIVASGILSERCLRGVRIRRLGADAPFAQEKFPFRYEISRRGGPAFALILEEVSGDLTGAARIAYLEGNQQTVVRADFFAPRRGPYHLKTLRLTTLYPLGLFAKSRQFDLEESLWVFPRRIVATEHPVPPAQSRQLEGARRSNFQGTEDLMGLRELREGEDCKRIHWIKSATLGSLLTVERERDEKPQYILEVNELGGQQLDAECEKVAAQAHRLLSEGFSVGLQTATAQIRPSAGPLQEHRILCALAAVGFEVQS